MGRDKAAIEVEGEPLLVRTVRVALSVVPEVAVVGRSRPKDWPFESVSCIEDREPDMGPLGGLATALTELADDVILLACDQPRLDSEALEWLVAQADGSSAPHGIIVNGHRKWEPVFSVYRQACLPLIERVRGYGIISLRGLISKGEFDFVDATERVNHRLFNMNRPEDVAQI